ncbi:MAG: SBBP repeat-containing protein, partial [Thermoplasmata archaeon]|nr:SBBP repeat-containing protein [Thermoplasmata archaeon]
VARDLTVDDEGHIYLLGHSDDPNVPVTNGSYDNSSNGATDGFIMKFDPNATELLYCTFIGGRLYDFPMGIAVDDSGSAIVVGSTYSSDFPTTVDAYDSTLNGGTGGFLLKMSPDGSDLEYSTLIDGAGQDHCEAMTLTPSGEVLVSGQTSGPFPTTTNAIDRTFNGHLDCFFLEFDIASSSLLYSTYLGGSSLDAPNDMALDGEGNVYITGITWSRNFPTTPNALDDELDGHDDGFITKLNSSYSRWDFSTYLGGSNSDFMYGIHVDAGGRAAVTGVTRSTDYPTTGAAIDDSLGGSQDACIAILSPDGSFLEYSSYLGGTGDDEGRDIWKDPDGFYVVVGETRSDDFPVTDDAYDTTHGSLADVFVTRLDLDLEGPWVVSAALPDLLTTGDPFTVELETRDNLAVVNATIEHWIDDDDVHTNTTLAEAPGPGDHVNWTLTTVAPSDRIGEMNYIFRVTDLAGNVNSSLTGSIPLRDNDPPVLSFPTPPVDGYGLVFNITGTVVDNIDIQVVNLTVWFGSDDPVPVVMQMEVGGDGSTYHLQISTPPGFVGRLSYVVEAIDTSGNTNRTMEFITSVRDDLAPEFLGDLSDANGTTGDPFTFKAEVRDNIAVGAVYVLFWFGNQGVDGSTNLSMAPLDVSGRGNGTYVVEGFAMPTSFVGKCHYSFHLVDPSGNWFSTPPGSVDVMDNDGPEVVEDTTSTLVTTGDAWTIQVHVRDNIGVTSVALHHNIPGLPSMRVGLDALVIDGRGNGTYGVTLEVPNEWAGPFNYSFEMTDIHRNQQDTETVSLRVVDDEAPSIGVVETVPEGVAVKGLSMEVLAGAEDNIGPPVMFIEFWFDDGEHENASMVQDVDSYPMPRLPYSASIEVPRHVDGPMRYLLSARDGEGNWASGDVRSLELENRPPSIDPLPEWTVVEEEETRMDLTSYVRDENDPIGSLTMEVDHPGLACEGLVLVAMFDAWVPAAMVTIVVTDGEDTVSAKVRVTVRNVNDPPVVLDIMPASGSVFAKGKRIDLHANTTDEDGDAVTLTWMDGDKFLGTGQDLGVSDLSPGTHVITVVVSDGTDATTGEVEVTVKDEKRSSSWTTIV